MKILIDIEAIHALISWIPNEGGLAAELINEILARIAPKRPEVVQSFSMAFDALGDPEEISKIAGMSGCAIAAFDWWPTEMFVIANVPDNFVGKLVWLKREKDGSYDSAKVLEMVEAKFAEAEKSK